MLKWLKCYNFVFLCLTRLYVVIVCDGCIILDVVVNSINEDVWGSEDELTGALSDEVDSWY